MQSPKFLKGLSVPYQLNDEDSDRLNELNALDGVLEIFHYQEMQTLYIKYDPDLTNDGIIHKTLGVS